MMTSLLTLFLPLLARPQSVSISHPSYAMGCGNSPVLQEDAPQELIEFVHLRFDYVDSLDSKRCLRREIAWWVVTRSFFPPLFQSTCRIDIRVKSQRNWIIIWMRVIYYYVRFDLLSETDTHTSRLFRNFKHVIISWWWSRDTVFMHSLPSQARP